MLERNPLAQKFAAVPLQLRLTIMIVLLLAASSVTFAIILNFSAAHMATQIAASATYPAFKVPEDATAIIGSGADAIPMTPLTTAAAAKQSFRTESLVAMLAIVAGGGALTYFVAGHALKPLKTLSAQMQKTTTENLTERVHVSAAKDEVSGLAQSFNEMTGHLNEAFLAQARFSASAAHELRTPLAVVQTKLDVFRKKSDRPVEAYDALLASVENQVQRLSGVVSSLLELTNLRETDCSEIVPLHVLLQEAAEELVPFAQANSISLRLRETPMHVNGNSSLLYRAFCNLIENAIRYNRPHGVVEISATRCGTSAIVTISDSGAGIPDAKKALVFEPFYCVDKSRSRQSGGSGLGLSIVKTIVAKHQGHIAVRDNDGGGTVMEVDLPNATS